MQNPPLPPTPTCTSIERCRTLHTWIMTYIVLYTTNAKTDFSIRKTQAELRYVCLIHISCTFGHLQSLCCGMRRIQEAISTVPLTKQRNGITPDTGRIFPCKEIDYLPLPDSVFNYTTLLTNIVRNVTMS